jgi:hypothetical protein
MRNHHRAIFLGSVLLVTVGIFMPCAAQNWTLKGLSGRIVNCIGVDDSGRVIAGLVHDQMDGMYVAADNTNASFSAVAFSLWVDPYALVKINAGMFFFVGHGQNESTGGTGDGIFKLQWVDQYTFTRMNTREGPSAVTARIVHGPTRDTTHVFVGSGTAVTHGLWKGYPPLTMDTVKTPANAFGTQKPYCAVMCVYGAQQKCYVGGYDTASVNPGASNLLCEVRSDSMTIKRAMKVSALCAGTKYLYVGTRDDGIYRYQEASGQTAEAWTHATGPAGGAIAAIAAWPASSTEDALYVAASSGVYKGRSTMTGGWTKLGTLAATPRCLTKGMTPGELYAGTDSGIHHFNDVAAIKQPLPAGIRGRAISIAVTAGASTLSFSVAGGQDLSLRLCDLRGALIGRANPALGAASFPLPAGACVYQLKSGNTVLRSGMIAAR